MTPSARLQAVIEIIEKMSEANVPMDTLVGDYMRVRRYIGAKDRAAIVDQTYRIARAWLRLDWWLQRLSATDTARNRVLIAMALLDKKPAPHIRDLCTGERHAPEPLEDSEATMLQAVQGEELDHADMPESVRVECPPHHVEALQVLFGPAFAAEMQAMQKTATLDLRVNTRMVNREKAQASLTQDSVETAPTPYAPNGLRVQAKVHLSQTKAFTKAWVDIQDEGSQMIAALCGARPGMQVLDFCAGAGGKTLALANDMQVKGRVVAMDTDAGRLGKARVRLRRAFVTDIIELRPLSEEQHRKWFKRQKGTFDVVLLDVPCSGTGTWRRNPDMRWRSFGPGLDSLMQTQAEILDKACVAVKPGGRLVYATCSLLRQENEDQVDAFLARHPDFAVLPVSQAWPSGSAMPAGQDPFMRFTPHRTGTDGFFAAVLQRREATPEEAAAE
ncbi:MAG: RsmB/NOP family class I SAM-dependent RNA methyltransferase [Pseudomonadota bacterium]